MKRMKASLFKRDYFGLELTMLIIIVILSTLFTSAMFGEIST
jgi:hypothetical protein